MTIGINQQPGSNTYPFIVTGDNVDIVNSLCESVMYLQIVSTSSSAIPTILATNITITNGYVINFDIISSTNVCIFSKHSDPVKTVETTDYRVFTFTDGDYSIYNTKVVLYVKKNSNFSINNSVKVALDARALIVLPASSWNLYVKNGTNYYDGRNVKLKGSSNIQVNATDASTIKLDFTASSPNFTYLTSINYVEPDKKGNINFSYDGCLKISRFAPAVAAYQQDAETGVTRNAVGANFLVEQRCPSCCTCEEMANFYAQDLTELQQIVSTTYYHLSTALSYYNSLCVPWEEDESSSSTS